MNPKGFLSLPIRYSLDSVSWASLSVRWIPTKDQRERRREEIESLWLPRAGREARPPLHPLDGRLFPFERFYSRLDRADKTVWPVGRLARRGGHCLKCPSVS